MTPRNRIIVFNILTIISATAYAVLVNMWIENEELRVISIIVSAVVLTIVFSLITRRL